MTEKQEKAAEKKAEQHEAKVLAEVESHVNADFAEQPDHSAQRAVEAHRQAHVGRLAEVDTGDDSAVHPQPDREAPGVQHSFLAEPDGERQVTEQPDRYAVGDEAAEYAVEPNKKNTKGRGRRAKPEESAEHVESPSSLWPAQFDGDGKESYPAQYSWDD